MSKSKINIEIIVDSDNAEEVAHDFRRLFWKYKLGLYSYKSTTKPIPVAHCTYCKSKMFEKTSNGLCHDPHCTKLRQDHFNERKEVELDNWKRMMCDQCSDNNDEAYCYLNDDLVHDSSVCNGCRYDIKY